MVMLPADFCLHSSLRKTLRRFIRSEHCDIRVDTAFEAVIGGCAQIRRDGQSGTWIVPEMIDAYIAFHRAGFAHSVETWIDNRLVGGLYFIAIGQAVFGESMFHRVTDGSKMALAALVCMCRKHKIPLIDCQQNTRHLASLGAREVSRALFTSQIAHSIKLPAPEWQFQAQLWTEMAGLNFDRVQG